MTNVYMVGDCHLSRALEHYNPSDYENNFIVWAKAGTKAFGFDVNELKSENMISSGVEIQRKYPHTPITFSEIKDDSVVVFWLGYIDIRLFLNKYKNADEVVKSYIDHIKSNFTNSRVILLEPLPQFTEMLLKYEGISPSYTYEERLDQNSQFLSALHKYAKEAGFEIAVTQQDILDVLDVKELTPDMTHSDAPHPVDGLQPIYMEKIFKLFANKITELLSN